MTVEGEKTVMSKIFMKMIVASFFCIVLIMMSGCKERQQENGKWQGHAAEKEVEMKEKTVEHAVFASSTGELIQEKIKKESDEQPVKVTNRKDDGMEKDFIDFSWIERGYEGRLGAIPYELGTDKSTILNTLSEPIDSGYYEGGEFFQFEKETYFFNPLTDQLVAIAIPLEEHQFTIPDIRRALGSPDISEWNLMDDLWMIEYKLDRYRLMFEAVEEDGMVLYVWLREPLDG